MLDMSWVPDKAERNHSIAGRPRRVTDASDRAWLGSVAICMGSAFLKLPELTHYIMNRDPRDVLQGSKVMVCWQGNEATPDMLHAIGCFGALAV